MIEVMGGMLLASALFFLALALCVWSRERRSMMHGAVDSRLRAAASDRLGSAARREELATFPMNKPLATMAVPAMS